MKQRKPSTRKSAESQENLLALHLRAERLSFVPQYQAVPGRKFRWDFMVAPDLLVEVQGGAFSKGKMGHATGVGMQRDCEKMCLGSAMGFRCMAVTSEQVKSGQAIAWIKAARDHGIAKLKLKAHEL